MMLMAGTNITAAGDPLKKIHESYLFNSIRHPRPHLESDLRQLRIVYSLDSRQYAALKKNLPYFVCGIFSPPVRRKENFAYIDRFVIDIDGMAEKGLSTDEVKRRICSDDRVMMCFVSPSEDGLKVMWSGAGSGLPHMRRLPRMLHQHGPRCLFQPGGRPSQAQRPCES